MKRLVIGTVVLAAIAAPLMSMNASAGGLKLKKPKKIDLASVVIQGGNPYPLGLNGEFGKVQLSFPAPSSADPHVDNFTVTCTPVYKIAPTSTDFPTAPLSVTFGPISSLTYDSTPALVAQGYSKDATGIHLLMPQYSDPTTSGPGAQYPPLACKIDTSNSPALHPGVYPGGGGGTGAGKAPKSPTSPAVDCSGLDGAIVGQPGTPSILPPVVVDAKTNLLHLGVQIDAGGGINFAFCSTDPSYRAKYLTDQATTFTAAPKVKFKAAKLKKGVEVAPAVRLAFIKKLTLVSPVNSSIPLTVSGSVLNYTFDHTKIQVVGGNAGCTPKAPKNPTATNTCVVNNALGTITMTSTDSSIVKPGKPIVSAPMDLALSYVTDATHPATTSDIKFVSANTSITIGATTVAIVLKATGSTFGLPDANIDAPVVSLTGLL
jgi:hypothetical protein